MERQTRRLYEFGPFQLDPAERLLRRADSVVPLTPKAFETLLALVENSGHLLEKEELMSRLWPESHVEEANLSQQIFTLRKALGDDNNGNRYIETVPKRGYRFVMPVRCLDGVAGVAPDALAAPAATTAGWRAVAGWTLLAISLALVVYSGWRATRPATPPTRITLAVLPFENLSGDPEQEYFADGLTEEMIARLSRVNPAALAVIARTSAMKFKGSNKGAAEIGRELGADYLLESSFRREGDRVRITAQLVSAGDQTHLWAENYDREVGQILPLQRELTETIARQVHVVLAPHSGAPTLAEQGVDWQAHLLYLKGRYYWNIRRPDTLKQAVEFYRQALDRDPNYAPAWAGLATAYAVFDEYNVLTAHEAVPRAKAAAARALELDPTQAEARAALALVRAQYDWDRTAAEQDFKQAIASDPNHAVVRHWYGMSLMAWGRSGEARQQFEQALRLDPLSTSLPVAIGASYYHARQFDQAIEQYLRAVNLRPDSAGIRFHLARAYLQKQMLAEALTEFETGSKLSAGQEGDESLALGYAAAGRTSDALLIVKQLHKAGAEYSPYYMAAVFAALGNRDQAIAELERAYERRMGRLTFLNVEPMFDPLRNDPRFRGLCQRIGLPDVARASN